MREVGRAARPTCCHALARPSRRRTLLTCARPASPLPPVVPLRVLHFPPSATVWRVERRGGQRRRVRLPRWGAARRQRAAAATAALAGVKRTLGYDIPRCVHAPKLLPPSFHILPALFSRTASLLDAGPCAILSPRSAHHSARHLLPHPSRPPLHGRSLPLCHQLLVFHACLFSEYARTSKQKNKWSGGRDTAREAEDLGGAYIHRGEIKASGCEE